MTEKYSFIASLKSTLPEESWPWVIPALRQDDLIWQSLQDPKFGEQALRHIGSQPDDWSPASLALLASGYNQHISLETLNPEIRQNALHAFEQFVKPASPHAYDRLTLAKSGLLAIALVERFNRVGSWLGLEADLRNVPVTSLKTPIACLCGITPDRDGLLRFLAGNSAPQEYQELLIHAVLCMPQRLHDHAKTLHAILKDLPLSKCLHALTHLKKLRPNFATSLARLFLESQPTLSNRRSFPSYQENLEQISQLLRSADIFDIANLPSQAASLRSLALETTRELGVTRWLAFKDTDHLLRRLGEAEIIRLMPGHPIALTLRPVVDEAWAVLEGVVDVLWHDLRPRSPTNGVRYQATLRRPALLLAPFGVAFGARALEGAALLARFATHGRDDPESRDDATLEWEASP